MPLAQLRIARSPLRLAAVLLASGASLTFARQAAPPGQIPCALTAKQSMEAADEQTIRQFVAANTPDLTNEDQEKNSGAREALMSPLGCDGVTFAFRSKYGDALVPALVPVTSSKDERHAANALFILGRVRTTASADAIAPSLKSGNPVIRCAAASACRDIVSQLAKDSFGFPEGAVDRLFDSLAAALRSEADPATADILTVALGDASKASAALRGRAMLRLTDAMAKRLLTLRKEAAVDHAWSRTVLRSLDLARQAMLEQGGAGSIDKEFARRAGVFAGQVFAFARDRAGRMSAADVDLSKAVAAAEGLAVIAHGATGGQRLNERGLQKAFDASIGKGAGSDFDKAAQFWIGGDGLLLKPPYNAPAGEFAPAG